MDQIITAHSLNANISPFAFYRYAKHYYECKQLFHCPDNFSPVPYFLLCRSIELVLKASHLRSMTQNKVKKEFGHNIFKSYQALNPIEQILNTNENTILEQASQIYKGKGFEYFEPEDALTGYKRFPDLEELDAIAKKLLIAAIYK